MTSSSFRSPSLRVQQAMPEVFSSTQEIFDFVLSFLRKQGEASVARTENNARRCLYRGPNGLACAAGCLVPDEVAGELKEGKTIDAWYPAQHRRFFPAVFPSSPPLSSVDENERIQLLGALQDAHDGCLADDLDAEVKVSRENWEERMKKIASAFRLTFSEEKEAS